MRVRLLTARVEAGGYAQQFGDVIDVPTDEGQRMVARGLAALVRSADVETAMLTGGTETAARAAQPQRSKR